MRVAECRYTLLFMLSDHKLVKTKHDKSRVDPGVLRARPHGYRRKPQQVGLGDQKNKAASKTADVEGYCRSQWGGSGSFSKTGLNHMPFAASSVWVRGGESVQVGLTTSLVYSAKDILKNIACFE